MKSLLLVAHGSRRAASNEEVKEMTQAIEKQSNDKFSLISCAFLELAEPSIPQGVDHCVAEGADEIVVFPYFLSAGRHVSADIPEIIEEKKQEYPDKKIEVVTHLGAVEGVAGLILDVL